MTRYRWGSVDLAGIWPEGDSVDTYGLFLAAAIVQCEAYAPACPDIPGVDEIDLPPNYAVAVSLQTQALFNSNRANNGGEVGYGEQAVTVYPMDWTVKNLLRPKRGGFGFVK